MNDSCPRILEGLKNHVAPDVAVLTSTLRQVSASNEARLRQDAPATISRAAEWILGNAELIADTIVSHDSGRLPMSRAMIIEAFRNCVTRWTDTDGLRSLVREELQNLNVGKVLPPNVVFHNLAGNLFVSAWESITHATLLGSASLVRCSDYDRVFPAIWAHAIALANPAFKDLVAICEWPSEDYGRHGAAVLYADTVVVYGSDESVQGLRSITPWTKPFAGHGSTLSFALLGAEDLRNHPVEWLAEACAYDFAVYDQQGCLSPRALFIEDLYSRDVDRFIDLLYNAMIRIEKELPRGPLSLEDRAALARSRDMVLLDAASGGAGRRVSGNLDPFLLTVKPVSQFALGPVNRYADVYLYKDFAEVEALLSQVNERISTLAVADARKFDPALPRRLQVKRICEVGKMQIPPLAWCLDGYRPLQKMTRMQTTQNG